MDRVSSKPPSVNRRPIGITLIAVFWAVCSVGNIFQGFLVFLAYLGINPIYYMRPDVHGWFRFGVPAQLVLSFLIVAVSILVIVAVSGLLNATFWSYRFSLVISLSMVAVNLATLALYLSAPPVIDAAILQGYRRVVDAVVPFFVINAFWLVVIWSYLTRPRVKQYLIHKADL